MKRIKSNPLSKRFFNVLIISMFAIWGGKAQDITVEPSSGYLLAGLGESIETGFGHGWKSLWWHEQLPLKIITSDEKSLDESDLPAKHACNMFNYNGSLVFSALSAEGTSSYNHNYIVVTLPNGYRFTGYELILANDLPRTSKAVGNNTVKQQGEWRFYETNKDFDMTSPIQEISLGTSPSSTEEYIIKRTSLSQSDMGNDLYFVFEDRSSNNSPENLAIVRVKKFVIYYATDGDFTIPIEPTEDDDARSFVEIGFQTGKIGIGDVRPRTDKNNNTHFAYEYHEVEDLPASMLLYQENSVDGGKVVSVADKDIEPEVQNWKTASETHHYGLHNNTYYLETPTEAITTHGNHDPVGYRIVKADLTFSRGTHQQEENVPVVRNDGMFTISTQAHLNGDLTAELVTYYLHPSGRFVRAQSGETTTKFWQLEDDATSGTTRTARIYHEQNGEKIYIQYAKGTNPVITTTKPTTKLTLTDKGDGRIAIRNTSYYASLHWDSSLKGYKLTWVSGEKTEPEGTDLKTAVYLKSARFEKNVYQPEFNPQDFTVTVYNKEGNEHATFDINASNPSRTVSLTDLNNDAVKFKISGLKENTGTEKYRALFNANVTLEALDPYITSLDIVCTDNTGLHKLEEQFTATNFSVKGGAFTFEVPENWDGSMPCKFSFENLRNKYMDNTYYSGTYSGKARNSIVGSTYYPAELPDQNIYDINTEEEYSKKVLSLLCGTTPFYFTNAEELQDHTSESLEINTLHQYPFSISNYYNQTRYGEGKSTFNQLEMSVDKDGGQEYSEAERYIFTCDETRYNIAPTKQTQHRSYAYYKMKLRLMLKDYVPKLSWKEIYKDGEPCYFDNGVATSKSQWGLTIEAVEKETGVAVEGGGYLPVDIVEDAIKKEMNDPEIETPSSLKQLLYLDVSKLSAIVYSPSIVSGQSDELMKLKKQMAENSLIYLPQGMTYNEDNFAALDDAGFFIAGKDIVIQDRKPFYAPHDIQVTAGQHTSYTRDITFSSNKKVARGTIILPFQLSIDENGIHRNENDDCTFELHQMQADNCLNISDDDAQTTNNYFSNLTSNEAIKTAAPNTPYMFRVTKAPEASDKSFTVSQSGGTITKTETMKEDYTFYGENASGTLKGNTFEFQHIGSLSGKRLDKNVGYFYFGNDMLLNSKNLKASQPYVYVFPFRSYYTYTGTLSAKALNIIFGENDGWTTGVTDIPTADNDDVIISTGKGTLTVISRTDRTITVNSLGGISYRQGRVQAGVPYTVALPAGVYIVCSKKVIVK